MSTVRIISQFPPGGRCTLYARYGEAIAATLGWPQHTVHDECRDAHGAGFPSLWVCDEAIQPADGVILSPQDICDFLRCQAVEEERLGRLCTGLQAILDDFLENWSPDR
ncbi:hypothetical protein RHDC4_02420 [Rhodocyclaceae bacterium]|nr:hypothetical protein RHDC4_02420 [Rhodocyclaceae bacterium]